MYLGTQYHYSEINLGTQSQSDNQLGVDTNEKCVISYK